MGFDQRILKNWLRNVIHEIRFEKSFVSVGGPHALPINWASGRTTACRHTMEILGL